MKRMRNIPACNVKGVMIMLILGNPKPLEYFGPTVCKHYLVCDDVGRKKCLECNNFHPRKEVKKISYFDKKPEKKIKRGIRLY